MNADFTTLYKKYKQNIFSYLCYLSGDRSLAEEICQDVFLKVYLNITKFEGRSSFKTWIYKIARNAYIDSIKSKNKIKLHEHATLSENFTDTKMGPEEYTLNKETKILIQETLNTLPDKYRTLIILRDIQQLSYQEISDITNTNLNTIKVSIYRARREFRRIYQRWEDK